MTLKTRRLAVPAALSMALLAVAPSPTAAVEMTPTIVGGRDARGPAPYMVSLQRDAPDGTSRHTCAATSIGRGWMVTAAHCVTAPPASLAQTRMLSHRAETVGAVTDASTFSVRVGSPDRTQGGIQARVDAIEVHPQWDWGQGDAPVHDIALLYSADLARTTAAGIAVAPVPARSGRMVRLLGWGDTNRDPSSVTLSTWLQTMTTRVVPPHRCAAAGISVAEICVDNRHNAGPGAGDSGGPVLQRIRGQWQLAGVISRGSGPEGTTTNACTSVPENAAWIANTVSRKPSATPSSTHGAPTAPGSQS